MSRREWLKDEIKFLTDNYQKYSAKQLGKILNRTDSCIEGKANYLGLHKEQSFVYGIGINNPGKYLSRLDNNNTKEYDSWHDMIKRSYSKKYHQKRPTYIGCSVCKNWIEFQNYAEWYHKNYYTIENERIQLDKDIIIKGNKIYSSDRCIFVPVAINSLLTKANINRGKLPIGVTTKNNKTFISTVTINNKHKQLGTFDTPEEAFEAYAKKKKEVMFEVLSRYKEIIPTKVYNKLHKAFTRYKIEITD